MELFSVKNNEYGACGYCGGELAAIWFTEEETKVHRLTGGMYKTGRKRANVDYLICETCLHRECVDDSFAGEWYTDENR